jgi:hypothetical protein
MSPLAPSPQYPICPIRPLPVVIESSKTDEKRRAVAASASDLEPVITELKVALHKHTESLRDSGLGGLPNSRKVER